MLAVFCDLQVTAESEAIDRVGQQLPSRREQLDTECRFPSDLAADAAAAGLFDQLRTRELGGCNGLTGWLHNGIRAARWDGSFGWLISQGSAMLGLLAVGAPDLASRVYEPRRFVVSSTNAGAVPLRADGDALIANGTVPFTSGCDVATGILGLGFLDSEPAGPDNRTYIYAPADSWEIVRDWDVVGLRGTGSHSIRATDLRIPAGDGFDAGQSQVPDDPLHFMAPSVGGSWPISYAVAATQLGTARRALDEAYDIAATKTHRPSLELLDDRPAVRDQLMELEASWHQALAGAERSLDGLWKLCLAGEHATSRQRALLAMAALNANRTAANVVNGVWRIAGTSALSPDHPIARCAADIRPLIGHIACNDTVVSYAAARWRDEDPGNPIV